MGAPAAFAIIFFAQAVLAATAEDVLRQAFNDPRTKLFHQAVEITDKAQSINPIDKAELKLSRSELLDSDSKVSVRFYPKGLKEYAAERDYQKSLKASELAFQKQGLSEILLERYQLLARIKVLKEKKKISEEFSGLIIKANKALAFAAKNDRTELKSLLKAQSDLEKLTIKFGDLDRDFLNLETEMKDLELLKVDEYTFQNFVSVGEIQDRITKLKDHLSSVNQSKTLSVVSNENLKKRIDSELQVEKAQDSKWIDHVELSLKENKDEKIYGVEFSFNLPFLAADDLGLASKKAKTLRELAKLDTESMVADRENKNVSGELKTLIEIYLRLEKTQGAMNSEKMKKASRSISNRDPFLAIEIQKNWFESQDHLLELEARILDLYVLLLHQQNVFVEAPEKNHLSTDLRKI